MANPSKQRAAAGTRRGGSAAAIVALALLAPRVSNACAVCINARDDGTQLGFMLGTLIMTVLPFVVFGSILFFVRRRLRSAELEVIRSSSSPS
jgi:hypothetical protein